VGGLLFGLPLWQDKEFLMFDLHFVGLVDLVGYLPRLNKVTWEILNQSYRFGPGNKLFLRYFEGLERDQVLVYGNKVVKLWE